MGFYAVQGLRTRVLIWESYYPKFHRTMRLLRLRSAARYVWPLCRMRIGAKKVQKQFLSPRTISVPYTRNPELLNPKPVLRARF